MIPNPAGSTGAEQRIRYSLTRKARIVLCQPQLDALAAQIRAQLRYDRDGRLAPARRS